MLNIFRRKNAIATGRALNATTAKPVKARRPADPSPTFGEILMALAYDDRN